MSILIKGNTGNNGGISKDSYPPNEPSLISSTCGTDCAFIKWTDPEDTVISDTNLAVWGGTILVRNENNFPTKITDGVIVVNNKTRNAYADIAYVDNNLVKGKVYYYRFFVYNSNDNKNYYGTNIVFKITPNSFDTTLSNNTWDQINNAAENGVASSIWKIGDEITINVSVPTFGTDYIGTVTMQIYDFNHFDKSDGSGKAGIVFGTKDLWYSKSEYDTSAYNNQYSWTESGIRTGILNQSVYLNIQEDCKKYIKNVKVITAKTSDSDRYTFSDYYITNDYLFLPGYGEVGDTGNSYLKKINSIFPIFTDNNSRIKNYYDWYDKKYPLTYLSRQQVTGGYHSVYGVNDDGNLAYLDANTEYGICFCFCV